MMLHDYLSVQSVPVYMCLVPRLALYINTLMKIS